MVNSYAEIAGRYGLSRARVTQIMKLLDLPQGVQQYVLALPPQRPQLATLSELRRTAQEGHSPNGANRAAR